jgi:hypothetical protein
VVSFVIPWTRRLYIFLCLLHICIFYSVLSLAYSDILHIFLLSYLYILNEFVGTTYIFSTNSLLNFSSKDMCFGLGIKCPLKSSCVENLVSSWWIQIFRNGWIMKALIALDEVTIWWHYWETVESKRWGLVEGRRSLGDALNVFIVPSPILSLCLLATMRRAALFHRASPPWCSASQ